MRHILNREQIRAYDRLATECYKIPGVLLMENAGRGAADILAGLVTLSGVAGPRIAIVCGTGNNGGDGFVIARHFSHSTRLKVFITGDTGRIAGDARVNFDAMLACGIPHTQITAGNIAQFGQEIQSADFIVDAIFGTGLSRNIEGVDAQIIEMINATPAIRLALDLPSGLDSDRGVVLGAAIRAHHTVTFAHPKPGLFTPQGNNHAGDLHCVKIGAPDAKLLAETGFAAELIHERLFLEYLRPRDAATYKHKAGDLLIIAGSRGKTGAAKLAAEAALRTGAGLATVCTWTDALPVLEKEVKELMLAELKPAAIEKSLANALSKRSALVIGPGFGLDESARTAVNYVLQNAVAPLVIDADALTLCAQNVAALKSAKAQKILTPHTGELGRLLGITSAEIEADRFTAVRRAAALTESVTVLKGAHTLIAEPAGRVLISAEANPVLATAGSGDILAGIIGSFASQMPPMEAAAAGVFVHAAAANLWSERTQSDRGMLAGDIAALVPEVIGGLMQNNGRP
jgi:ADP-dependent NAD(P)H-hydrate dehydratase / NAD(P)H-hydrate epimerase